MKKQSTRKNLIAAGVALLTTAATMSLNAQVATTYTFSQSTGTYTALSGATVIASPALGNMDDEVFTVPMPTFYFDGVAYSSLNICTNGYVSFGSYASVDFYPISGTEPYDGVISAFGNDVNQAQAAAGTRNISYMTVGNEFVVQWQNVRRFGVGGERISFQIRLNTVNNQINIVYGGSIIPGDDQIYPEVGLRGPDNTFATNVNNREVLTGPWLASTAGVDELSTCTFDSNDPTAVPAVGLTYTWTPAPVDMQVTSLVAPMTGGCYGSNETVSVQIKNIGGAMIDFSVTPVTIDASSTGLNPTTFTPVVINTGTLAAGATQTVVVATGYDMSVAGQYTFEASTTTTGDAHTSNDAMATATRESHTPTVAMIPDPSICAGGMVTLDANATAHDFSIAFSNTTPLPIPDDDAVGVNSTITVSGQPIPASSVSVYIESIQHSFISDLTLTLTAPDGSIMVLFFEAGGADPNMMQTHFTATASTPIASGVAPFTGDFLPEEPFSQLTGTANGTWTLNIADNYNADVGTLYSWSILIPVTNSISTYAWSPAGSLSSSTVSNPDATPASTTTYSVVVTDISGCTNSGEVTVTVNTLPTVTASASATTVCENDNVTFTGGGALNYAWSGGVTDNVPFMVTATDTYTVTGTDANGCSNTDMVTVNVNALPAVTASASATTVCENDNVTFNGGGALNYAWSGGVTDNVPFMVTATDTYTVTGTDANGCSNTDMVTVNVNALPAVTASASATTICGSDSVTFTGGGAANYAWSGGVTDNVPFFVTTTDTYTVTGTDANGCSNTDMVTVTVNALPTVTVALPFDTACSIDGATTLSGESPVGGTWSGTAVTGNSFDPSAAGVGTFDLVYTYTDGNGCSASDTATVVVDICMGVAEANVTSSTVYPNPTSGTFTIELAQTPSTPVTVEVMNTLGQTVDAFTMSTTLKQVDLSNEDAGVYFVRVIDGTTTSTIRVVKQ